jgi:hypothetical protein
MSDIDTYDLREMFGDGLGQPPDPTAKIQCSFTVEDKSEIPQILDDLIDLFLTQSKELIKLPSIALFVGPGSDRPQWILFPEQVPIPLQLLKTHVDLLG